MGTQDCNSTEIYCDLVLTGVGAGMATTVSPRLSRMVAPECAVKTATGTTRSGATWGLTRTGAGWATSARTSPQVAALISARGEPWRRKRLWQTAAKTLKSGFTLKK